MVLHCCEVFQTNENYICQQKALKLSRTPTLFCSTCAMQKGQMVCAVSYFLMTARCLLVLTLSCSFISPKLLLLSSSPALFLLLFFLYEHLSYNLIKIIPPFQWLHFAIVKTVALTFQNIEQGATWNLTACALKGPKVSPADEPPCC